MTRYEAERDARKLQKRLGNGWKTNVYSGFNQNEQEYLLQRCGQKRGMKAINKSWGFFLQWKNWRVYMLSKNLYMARFRSDINPFGCEAKGRTLKAAIKKARTMLIEAMDELESNMPTMYKGSSNVFIGKDDRS